MEQSKSRKQARLTKKTYDHEARTSKSDTGGRASTVASSAADLEEDDGESEAENNEPEQGGTGGGVTEGSKVSYCNVDVLGR
jgi:hypothetical protein